jgi:hypothetical protein
MAFDLLSEAWEASMRSAPLAHDSSRLRFLSASKLGSPAGELSRMALRSTDDLDLGSLDGVLVDPVEQQVRFYVIASPGWLRRRVYLLPADCLAQLEGERILRLHVKRREVTGCEEFDYGVRELSDESS